MSELKLSLHNFQSISDGELIFNTGLNFIIGQSNSGKSATFRALKACLLNPKGSQRFIKNGTSKAEVTLEYNGNEITWDRTSKESKYIINGEPFYKTGSSNAFKILNDEAGFARDDNDSLMNIEEELQLPFPFGITGSELFKLFENVFCVSDSAVILKSAKEYEKGVESSITSLELEQKKVDIKIKELQDFKDSVSLEKLLRYQKYFKSKEKRLELLNDGLDLVQKAIKVEKANLEVEAKNFTDLFSPYLQALECRKALIRTRKFHNLGKSLQELTYSPSNLLVQYNDLCDLNNCLQKLKKLNKIKVREESFESKIERFNELKTLRHYIKEVIPEKIKELEQNKKREEEKVKSIEAKLKEFKVCPLCHHSLED